MVDLGTEVRVKRVWRSEAHYPRCPFDKVAAVREAQRCRRESFVRKEEASE